MKRGTFLNSLRRNGYLAAKPRGYERPVVNYNAVLLFFSGPQTTARLCSDVNHSFLTMTTLETALRPKPICKSCYFERFTSTRKLFLLLLYGPVGKGKQMSSTRQSSFFIVVSHHYDFFFHWFVDEIDCQTTILTFVRLFLLCCSTAESTSNETKALKHLCYWLDETMLWFSKWGLKTNNIGTKFWHQGSH